MIFNIHKFCKYTVKREIAVIAKQNYISILNSKASIQWAFTDIPCHFLKFPQPTPKCIAGKRACPPEDCGGVWGYAELVDIMNNPKHLEYKERKEWLGGKLEPEKFDPKAVVFEDPKERLKLRLE